MLLPSTPIRAAEEIGVPRRSAYGQRHSPTMVDRFGIWLSSHRFRQFVPSFAGKRIADVGCGYHASFARTVLPKVRSAVLIDLVLDEDLKDHPKVLAIEGTLPEVLECIPIASLDVVICNSVLEHLWEPLEALRQFRRVLAPGGVCLLNVPSWKGKRFLEFSAFTLGLSPSEEMDDHKMYFDVKEFWPLLVQAGFVPHNIRCFSHKFGLNTFAVAKVDGESAGG